MSEILYPVKRFFRVNCRDAARGGFLQVKKPPCLVPSPIKKETQRILERHPLCSRAVIKILWGSPDPRENLIRSDSALRQTANDQLAASAGVDFTIVGAVDHNIINQVCRGGSGNDIGADVTGSGGQDLIAILVLTSGEEVGDILDRSEEHTSELQSHLT